MVFPHHAFYKFKSIYKVNCGLWRNEVSLYCFGKCLAVLVCLWKNSFSERSLSDNGFSDSFVELQYDCEWYPVVGIYFIQAFTRVQIFQTVIYLL